MSTRAGALCIGLVMVLVLGTSGRAGPEGWEAELAAALESPDGRVRAEATGKLEREYSDRVHALMRIAEKNLGDTGSQHAAHLAVYVLGKWRVVEASDLLARHLTFAVTGKKPMTLFDKYPCAGALAEIGVGGVEAAAGVVLAHGAAATDVEVRVVAAIVAKELGDDLGRTYCTFKKERAEGAGAKALWERVKEGVGAKKD